MYPSPTFKTTSAPAIEPITIDELKTRLRITSCHFDSELQDLLKAARTTVENESNRRLITQTLEMHIEDFPRDDEIEMRMAPIQSITHVKYYDQDDVLQTLNSSTYYTDLTSVPPRLELKNNQTWPLTSLEKPNKVVITMVVGYGATAASIPPAARLAIVEYCRAHREGCDGSMSRYKALLSEIQWTAFHKVDA
jgi:uncharacterized phiE125 gp8 family phage protein